MVVTTPPVTTVTGIDGGVAVAGGVAVQVNDVADTNVVVCGTPLMTILDCLVNPTPVAVMVIGAVACTLVVGAIVVSVGLVVGDRLEAWLAFGPARMLAAVCTGPHDTDLDMSSVAPPT